MVCIRLERGNLTLEHSWLKKRDTHTFVYLKHVSEKLSKARKLHGAIQPTRSRGWVNVPAMLVATPIATFNSARRYKR
jgi:hypothetical protein